ncbi:SUMF1/EgtB/PvdO family nonheme iron enzyme, partial [bacterium]|nr:SUMF1/EgtB/PvdO family nonheme iron enzyme [bacterium]
SSSSPPKPGTRHPKPSSPAASRLEKNAALCLQYARQCVGKKSWSQAQSYLDQLKTKYGTTKFAAANRAAIAAVQAQVTAALKAKAAPPTKQPEPKGKATPTPPVKPAPVALPPPDAEGWVSLFDGKTLDGWRRVKGGEFARPGTIRVDDAQVILAQGQSRTGIAWEGDVPEIDYEFECEAKRLEGARSFCTIVFPIAKAGASLVVGEWEGEVVAIGHVNGQSARDNETTTRVKFQNGRWYRIRLSVTRSRIGVWIDGERLIDLPTAGRIFSVAPQQQPAAPFALSTFKAAAALRNIRLRRLQPEAKPQVAGPWKVYTNWPFDAAEAKRRQAETAAALGVPVEQEIDLGNGVKMTVVLIPAGRFVMGSPADEPGRESDGREGPQHEVKITKPFYMATCEVTQQQYKAVMVMNPSEFKGAKNPVEHVSWDDAVAFCKALSRKTGKTVRLPTEAEWEYACRAGTKTRCSFGDEDKDLDHYAWHAANSGKKTHPVGEKKPNTWGLYDMHGNVFEWCSDWYDEKYYLAIASRADPAGPVLGDRRVHRGAAWYFRHSYLRSARRGSIPPVNRSNCDGFRVVVGPAWSQTETRQPTTAPGALGPGATAREVQAKLQAALGPAEKKTGAWDFAGALALVGAVSVPRELEERLAAKKDEVARLVKLKVTLIARVKTATPKLTKRALLLKGIGGNISAADEKGLTAKLPNGKTES